MGKAKRLTMDLECHQGKNVGDLTQPIENTENEYDDDANDGDENDNDDYD